MCQEALTKEVGKVTSAQDKDKKEDEAKWEEDVKCEGVVLEGCLGLILEAIQSKRIPADEVKEAPHTEQATGYCLLENIKFFEYFQRLVKEGYYSPQTRYNYWCQYVHQKITDGLG